MGPLPTLPSSQSLSPLVPLFPTAADPQARRAPADSRPVGLPSDQVLPVADEVQNRVQEKPVRPEREENRESKREENAPKVEVENPRLERRPTSVTYRIHPDLQRALQGNVIDSETSEVLREIPSEDRIQLTKAFRENLGSSLDVTA